MYIKTFTEHSTFLGNQPSAYSKRFERRYTKRSIPKHGGNRIMRRSFYQQQYDDRDGRRVYPCCEDWKHPSSFAKWCRGFVAHHEYFPEGVFGYRDKAKAHNKRFKRHYCWVRRAEYYGYYVNDNSSREIRRLWMRD